MGRRRMEAVIHDGFYVVGDQAYTPAEWAQRERRREQYRRAYHTRIAPEWREAIGSLHALSCRVGHHRQRIGKCVPVPVYPQLRSVA